MTADGASYELLELIGSGGMGHVYRARHHPTGQVVAAKVPHDDLPDRLRHVLVREAAAVARLQHPNIVELVDLVEGPVLVMELVEGTNLRDHRSAPGSWIPGARILIQVLDGLAAAHAEGIVHGDLKPANVLVSPTDHVKITDFGLAQLIDPLRRATQARKAAGTPAYMAPEQFGDGEELGPWTDLYAVGVILYRMLHGRMPHEGSLSELAAQKATGHLPPRPLRPGLSEEPRLMDLVRRLLCAHPRRRPRFARDVRDELMQLVELSEEATVGLVDDPVTAEGALAPTLMPSALASETSIADPPVSEPTALLPQRVTAWDVVGHGLFHLRGLPLIARASEQARVRALMERVIHERRVRVLVVTGPAGSGKSALARWGLGVAERGALMEGLAAGYDLSGGGMTGGLQHLLRRLLVGSGPETETHAEAWSWLADEGRTAFDVRHVRKWLASNDGIASDEDLKLLRDVLKAAAMRRPLYLWLDDIGWSRDGAFDLIEALLEEHGAPILVMVTLRSGTAGHPWVSARVSALARHSSVERLELGPLSPVGRLELVEQVVPLVADLSAALTGKLQPNPRQLLEQTKSWVERGLLAPGPMGWSCAEAVTVAQLLADAPDDEGVARRLAAVARASALASEVLLRGALLGFTFEESLLLASFPPPEWQEVRGALGRALLEGVLSFDQIARVHRFESEAIHGYILDTAGDLAQASARCLAKTLAAEFGEGRVGVGARTAYLHRLAGERARSYEILREAVGQLGRLGWLDRAEELAAVAQAWREADGDVSLPEQVDVVVADALRHYHALRYPQTLECLEVAKRLLVRAEDAGRDAMVLNLEMTTHHYANRLGTAAKMADANETICDGAIDAGLWRVAFARFLMRAELLGLAGRHDEALAQTSRGVERFALSPVLGHRMIIRVVHCEQLVAAGRLEEADVLGQQLRRKAEATEALRDELLDLCARVDAFVGRWAGVAERFEARLEIAQRHRDPWRATAHRVYLAWYAVVNEADDAAVAMVVASMLEAYAAAPQEEAMTTLALGHLAAGLRHRGQVDLAARVQRVVDARHEAIRLGFER